MEYGAIDLHLPHSLIRIVMRTGAVTLDRKLTTTPRGYAGIRQPAAAAGADRERHRQ